MKTLTGMKIYSGILEKEVELENTAKELAQISLEMSFDRVQKDVMEAEIVEVREISQVSCQMALASATVNRAYFTLYERAKIYLHALDYSI